jgi:hypothetical protein
MVSSGYEQDEERRRAAGIPTLRWYRCNTCNAEYSMQDGVRAGHGCANANCEHSNIHVISDLDGEQPRQLK